MRVEIDKIKEDFDNRMFHHQRFKTLIKYNDSLLQVNPERNQDFGAALGSDFYERQQNAQKKIMSRWNIQRFSFGKEDDIHEGEKHNKRLSVIDLETPLKPIPFGFLCSKEKEALSALQSKAKKAQIQAEKEKQVRTEALKIGLDSVVRLLEAITVKIDERIQCIILDSAVSDGISYFNEHKYQICYHLKVRNFVDPISLLGEYEYMEFPATVIRAQELLADVNTLAQLYSHMVASRDESYQSVLTQKAKMVGKKYQDLLAYLNSQTGYEPIIQKLNLLLN